ncbi:NAD-binding protein [Rickenella mellea]|uniref:NAD-binding protein n=1 Tax=Rickenella mellea TaxID=50990 RepID=A0A4Y7QHQ9_9AGAM|nr:NAD-binding protein [Rickenella mellea]
MSTKRVAIITGAAQGIGKAIALRLAADGFDIGLNDLPSEEQVQKLKAVSDQIQALGRKACIVAADVSIESAVEGMLKDVISTLGGVDVMVANAGVCELSPLVSTPVEQWDEIQGVNLRGVFLCFKHAAKQMLEQNRGGRLIGGGSLGGFSGLPMGSAYAASKAGMRALTHSAARELGPSGITVNTYAPGVVVTDLTLRNYGAEFLEQQKGSCAIGDHGTPEDIAALVSFLSSKESRFITGQTIMIDGGRLCT